MIRFVVFFFGFQLFWLPRAEGVRCFECSNYPSPSLCLDVTTCTTDEDCYVEQVVTTGGRVVYNSGCITQSRCSSISDMVGKRVSDITTCKTCCHGDLCNNKGCSKTAIPRAERGPYCYACPLVSQPDGCDKLTICGKDQQCLLSIPLEFQAFPEPLYRAECESIDACGSLSSTFGACPARCCDTDFCNNQCANLTTSKVTQRLSTTMTITSTPSPKPSTTTTSTSAPTTNTTTTTATSTTPTPTVPTTQAPATQTTTEHEITTGNPCPSPYHLVTGTTLCIIVHEHAKTWQEARTDCQQDGGDLLVYKTDMERWALMSYLSRHLDDHHIHEFWIGLLFENEQHGYEFIDGDKIHQSMWVKGEPSGGHGSCGRGMVNDGMLWRDNGCQKAFSYICQSVEVEIRRSE